MLAVRNITREEKREQKKARGGKGHSNQPPSNTPRSAEHPSFQDNDPPQPLVLLSTLSETVNRPCIDNTKILSPYTHSKENSHHQLPSEIVEKSDINQDLTHSHSSLSPHILSVQDSPPTDSNMTPPHSFRHTPFSEMATTLSQVITASRSTKRQRRHREEEVYGEGEREQQESEEFQ